MLEQSSRNSVLVMKLRAKFRLRTSESLKKAYLLNTQIINNFELKTSKRMNRVEKYHRLLKLINNSASRNVPKAESFLRCVVMMSYRSVIALCCTKDYLSQSLWHMLPRFNRSRKIQHCNVRIEKR